MRLTPKQALILGMSFEKKGYPGMAGYLMSRVLRQNSGNRTTISGGIQNEPPKAPKSIK
jgi:uncharacterized protein YgiB involved in biofilm formation